jgi:biopolymer transport protein ExbD
LPESKQAQEGVSENNFIVEIDSKEPYLRVASRPVTLNGLQEILLATVKTNPAVKVAVRPDRNAPVEQVIQVMDAASAAGVKGQVSLFVKTPKR